MNETLEITTISAAQLVVLVNEIRPKW